MVSPPTPPPAAAPPPPLIFDTTFAPEIGKEVGVADGMVRVTAPNAGPYTFTGTNSFILGRERVMVVDPGPDLDVHLNALKAAIGGRKVEAILLTHTHRDHSGLAAKLKAETGAPIWFGGQHRLSREKRRWERNPVAGESDRELVPDRTLLDGERLGHAGMTIEVIATPGHCANHLCFGLEGTGLLLSGDHVMGWNSTLVPVPDGSMADYMASLEKLMGTAYATYHPAHGGPIADGRGYATALLAHRQARNRQILMAVRAGVDTPAEVRRRIYPVVDWKLVAAAQMTVNAHLEYLEQQGEIRIKRKLLGAVLLAVA